MRDATAVTAPPDIRAIARLRDLLTTYTSVDDFDVTLACLAAAVSARDDEGPLWLMPIGPSSSGKTEDIRLLEPDAEKVDDLTLAGLLGMKPIKKGQQVVGVVRTGLLERIGDHTPDALVIIPDFSTFLGDTTKGGAEKAALLAAFRRVHDGHFDRNMNDGTVAWDGKVTMVAACTSAIDSFTSMSDALGPRFVMLRRHVRDHDQRRVAAKRALTRTDLNAHRMAAQEVAGHIIAAGRAALQGVHATDAEQAAIVLYADTACIARCPVPRASGGDRMILAPPEPEEPMRMITEMMLLFRSLVAIEVSRPHALRIVRRVAHSSPSTLRATALAHLLEHPGTTAHRLKVRANVVWKTAWYCLEDLEVLGLACRVPDLVPDVGIGGEVLEPTGDPREQRAVGWMVNPAALDAVKLIWANQAHLHISSNDK